MLNHLLVFVGGAIGAVLRYRVGFFLRELTPAYPGLGTLVVNVIGSLVIGYTLGLPPHLKAVSDSVRLFFVIGVLGGLTTFSSLAYEAMVMLSNHDISKFVGLGHLSANLIFGLAAVWVGAWAASGFRVS